MRDTVVGWVIEMAATPLVCFRSWFPFLFFRAFYSFIPFESSCSLPGDPIYYFTHIYYFIPLDRSEVFTGSGPEPQREDTGMLPGLFLKTTAPGRGILSER